MTGQQDAAPPPASRLWWVELNKLNTRVDLKADWDYAGGLAQRIAELERWRAAVDAVSQTRRWALPVGISVTGLVLTVVNVVLLLTRHK